MEPSHSNLNLKMGENNDIISKLDQILDRQSKLEGKIDTLSKQVEEFDQRFSTIEGRVTANETRIDASEETTKKHSLDIVELNGKFNEVEKSCTHISDQYDKLLLSSGENTESISELGTRLTGIDKENINLKAQIAGLKHELEQEKVSRNTDAQYQRTSINVKLCGLPIQPGEDIQADTSSNPVTRALITRVCDAAGISLFNDGDIDVCHRLGSKPRCPIIIRFVSKSSRYNFFSQRYKLNDIDTGKLSYTDLPVISPPKDRGAPGRGGKAAQTPRWNLRNRDHGEAAVYGETEDPHPIYLQEHLTKLTKDLLKETKTVFEGLGYEYPGYIKDGEVRIKYKGTDKPIPIRCATDIKRIQDEHQRATQAQT